jgi:hypothetical protein
VSVRPRHRTVALAASAALALSACGGSSQPVVRLDGSPREPDAEGVVRTASINGITLDGGRRYSVSKKLISFSTYTRQPLALASTVGDYAHVGLKGDQVVWLARIGVVSESNGRRITQYQGNLVSVAGARLTFKDGTVLTLEDGLKAPADARAATHVVIDTSERRVVGASFQPATATTARSQN